MTPNIPRRLRRARQRGIARAEIQERRRNSMRRLQTNLKREADAYRASLAERFDILRG